jgi:mannitol/fructose-specific phosphotransferase system IIA component (Ntr-type)|tara:strand:- start:361 stop:525 length:165 start_codon:yes stop_codon:yes gene_type:complete
VKKYTVIQTYTAQDIWKNVEANSKEEAILKIGDLITDEEIREDTETEVIEENCS